jgi:hypothetical protein
VSAHNPLTLHIAGGQEMTDYEIASAALARAVSVVEVKRVNDAADEGVADGNLGDAPGAAHRVAFIHERVGAE